jgi:hypothetical protein
LTMEMEVECAALSSSSRQEQQQLGHFVHLLEMDSHKEEEEKQQQQKQSSEIPPKKKKKNGKNTSPELCNDTFAKKPLRNWNA